MAAISHEGYSAELLHSNHFGWIPWPVYDWRICPRYPVRKLMIWMSKRKKRENVDCNNSTNRPWCHQKQFRMSNVSGSQRLGLAGSCLYPQGFALDESFKSSKKKGEPSLLNIMCNNEGDMWPSSNSRFNFDHLLVVYRISLSGETLTLGIRCHSLRYRHFQTAVR